MLMRPYMSEKDPPVQNSSRFENLKFETHNITRSWTDLRNENSERDKFEGLYTILENFITPLEPAVCP